MMRRRMAMAAALGGLVPAMGFGQTHAVKKPDSVVRAVAVYEWTGDEAKPTASRLVPVSIFINNQFEDAGVYLARPVPFALDSGTVFEAEKAGVLEGTVQLLYERHLEGTSDSPFDDGWIGYGPFKPKPQETVVATAKSGPLPQVIASGGTHPALTNRADVSANDSGKPTMRRRTGSEDSTASSGTSTTSGTSSADSNKPVLQKRTDTSTSSSDSSAASTAGADDPDRPVLIRRSDSGGDQTASTTNPGTTPASTTSTGSTAKSDASSTSTRASNDDSDDADRPTLRRRSVEQQKQDKKKSQTASVTSGGSLNDDPDRPTLHRGSVRTPDIPALNGLPADMHQLATVSDAKDRPEHDFARNWESDAERAEVMAKMQEFARARLAGYDVPSPPTAAKAPAPASTKPATRASAKKTQVAAPLPAAPAELKDESLRGYTLSYGGAATYVYSASSPGAGGSTRYVSVVAQREPVGELKVAMTSVTDSGHLDRTPWMRLVDVVDADASNRASLLFELRQEHARQFALYRVIGARAEQIFSTGTTE